MDNGIIHVRVDDRLIHGQVANYWLAYYKSTRAMALDERASKSDMLRASLKMATPSGVSLSVLAPEKAIANINNGNYIGQRVFIVSKDIAGVYELFKNGVQFEELNLGNVTQNTGGTHVLDKTVRVNNEELVMLQEMNSNGITVYCRFAVDDSKKFLSDIEKNL